MVDLRDLDFHLEVVNLQNLAEIMSPAAASAGGISPRLAGIGGGRIRPGWGRECSAPWRGVVAEPREVKGNLDAEVLCDVS